MLQTLFRIPSSIGGVPTFGFGLLLAVWAAVRAVTLVRLVRKHGFGVETRSYLPTMLVLGAVIVWVLPLLSDSRGLPIRGYGMMILIAVVSSLVLAMRRARRAGADPEMIFALAFWMVLPGIIGARLFYVSEYWSTKYWPSYVDYRLAHPHDAWRAVAHLLGEVINVTGGGIVVFGALLGAAVGFFAFCWKYRVRILPTADLIAPSLVLGQAIGRLGCFLNGCCFGGTCDLPWKVEFPWNSPAQVHEIAHGEMPIFGFRLRNDQHALPAIDEIVPDSLAARAGLVKGDILTRINGIEVHNNEEAAGAIVGLNHLWFDIVRADHSQHLWSCDEPSEIAATGPIRLFGLTLDGSEDSPATISAVRGSSAEAVAGLRPGDAIATVNGIRVMTMRQLRDKLLAHHADPWLRIETPDRPVVSLTGLLPLPRSLAVHPTQLYSAIDAAVLCLLLLAYTPFRRREGEVTALMLTVHPIARFLLESIRTDEPAIWGTGLHISQNISLGLLAFAIGLWIYLLRRPKIAAE